MVNLSGVHYSLYMVRRINTNHPSKHKTYKMCILLDQRLVYTCYKNGLCLLGFKYDNKWVNSLSASLLLNIFLSFEVGIAHAIANFK